MEASSTQDYLEGIEALCYYASLRYKLGDKCRRAIIQGLHYKKSHLHIFSEHQRPNKNRRTKLSNHQGQAIAQPRSVSSKFLLAFFNGEN